MALNFVVLLDSPPPLPLLDGLFNVEYKDHTRTLCVYYLMLQDITVHV